MKFNLYKTWNWVSKMPTNYQYYAIYYTLIFNLFMTISIVINLSNILYMLIYTSLL